MSRFQIKAQASKLALAGLAVGLALSSGAALAKPAKTAPSAPVVATPDPRIAELEARLQQQDQLLAQSQAQLKTLQDEMALKDELLILGRDRNAELYAIALEVINKGLKTRSLEPFMQLSRVKMENLKQSYEDRLRAARIYETTLPPSVQKRMDAELSAPKQ